MDVNNGDSFAQQSQQQNHLRVFLDSGKINTLLFPSNCHGL